MSITRLMARARRLENADGGFTLIEMLIAGSLSIILGGLILATLVTTSSSVKATQAVTDLDGEATQLLNRMAGDLRQATPVWSTDSVTGVKTETPAITNVQNPSPGAIANRITSITFDADFSGDNCIAGITSDGCSPAPSVDPNNPETETFCWDPSNGLVYLIAGGVMAGTCNPADGTTAQPMLSGKVTNLQISCNSNNYLYDANHDGVTTWQELDAFGPPVGNKDGVLDAPELPQINSIQISVTVQEGSHSQTYQTLVSLRNVS